MVEHSWLPLVPNRVKLVQVDQADPEWTSTRWFQTQELLKEITRSRETTQLGVPHTAVLLMKLFAAASNSNIGIIGN